MTPDPEDRPNQNILELVHTYLCHINDGRPKAYGSDDVLYKLIELLIEEEEGA